MFIICITFWGQLYGMQDMVNVLMELAKERK